MDDPGSTRDEPLEPPSPPTSVVEQGATALPAPTVEVADPLRRLPPAALSWLTTMSHAAAAALGAVGEVRVRIVDDDEMDRAHRRYKGIPGTTDVLTFDYAAGGGHPPPALDADILVCADEAARQASGRGADTASELLLYIVHGMLHCLGHDDLTPEDAAAMHEREDEILTAIGVGPVFAPRAGAAGSHRSDQAWP